MSQELSAKPPAEWLEHLHEAGHWDRLIEVASESLATDPNDPETHRHIAWAYAKLGHLDKMKFHVDFLLNVEPEEERNHHLAAVYQFNSKRPWKAKSHVETLLRRDPHNPTYQFVACLCALGLNRIKQAREHIRAARSLAPSWPAAAHLEIEIDGMTQRGTPDAWERVRRLKEALALDPTNAAMLASIGTIYLTELEEPREAEQFFRQALTSKPSDRTVQRQLLDSIRARSFFYRTLSLPISALRKLRSYSINAGRLVILIFCFKVVLAFIAWLIVTGPLFAPAAKIYEWFVLVDVTRASGLPRFAGWLAPMLRWPLWQRLTLTFAVIMGSWILLFHQVFSVPPWTTFKWMTLLFSFHFIGVSAFVGLRRLRASIGSWWNTRRNEKRQKLAALGAETI